MSPHCAARNLREIRGKRLSGMLLGALAVLAAICAIPRSADAQEAKCDRQCLGGILDQYLTAVFHHNPAEAPLAPSYRSTENAVVTPAGEGVWKTATGYGQVERRYFDTATKQAAYLGLLREGEAIDIVSLRLKTDAQRRVSEAEWTIARKSYGGLMDPQGLVMRPPPDAPLPPAERVSREALIATANAYFEGLQGHDGSKVPKIDGCDRIENGVQLTNRTLPIPGTGPAPASQNSQSAPPTATETRSGDCTANFEGFAKTISETTHRRFPFVDEDFGLVIGMTIFHRPPGATMKRNLLTEYFFQKQGKLAYIAAAMYYLDATAQDDPGWTTE